MVEVRSGCNWEGIVVLDKPSGPTSHDVVDLVRKKLAIRQVGHTGTLDPVASGVLVIMLGKATKLSRFLMPAEKSYTATLKLGLETDTMDVEGCVTDMKTVPDFSKEEISCALESFKGDQLQVPPMYSAKKVNGKKLYKLARAGKKVEREPSEVTIFDIGLLDYSHPELTFYVKCSKGTYLRVLCSDIGRILGCCAYMTALKRIQNGVFKLENAVGLDNFMDMGCEKIKSVILSLDKVNEIIKEGRSD